MVKTTPEEVQIFTDMQEERDKLLAQLQKDPTALGSGVDQSFNPFAYGRKLTDKLDWFGNKTVQEYVDMLDAARASAALPEKVGSRRYQEGDRIFFQSENGTSVAAMMLFRLKELDKSENVFDRKITNGELSRLTLSEMSVYELATGRALEILDDRDIRGTKQQRYHQLIERRAYEMTKDIEEYEKIIKGMEEGSEKRAGAERSVARLRQQLKALFFDYDEPGSFQGEETGGFFPQLHGGKQWSQSLTEYFFYQEKAEAVKKIIGIWAEDIASEQGPGVGRTKKETLSKDPAWSSSVEAWNKLEPAKKAAFRNNLYSVVRELKKDESLTVEDIAKAKEQFEKLQKEAQKTYEENYEAQAAEETVQAAKEWGATVKAPDDYEFFAQGEKATSTVKAGNGHGAFARGSADKGVDVLSLFAKDRTDNFDPERVTFGTGSGSEQANPDLARDLERRLDEAIVKKSFEVMQDEKYQDIALFEITRDNGQKLKVKRVKGLWKKANGHVLDQETEKIAREDYIKNQPELINEIRKVMVAQDSISTIGVSSGNSVSPAQFVRYLLDNIGNKKGKAGLKEALLALQYTPSSEVDNGRLKQLPGGPAGGILPYVWNDFMLEVYKLLKIEKDFKFVPAPDPKKSGWKNQSETVERTINLSPVWSSESSYKKGDQVNYNNAEYTAQEDISAGVVPSNRAPWKRTIRKTARVSEPNTLWKNGYPDVDAMVEQVQPVIQAVYDAGRVMLAVGRGFDEEESSKNSLNANNVLQQDPTVHTSSFESFIKSDAPEGSLDNMETDSVVNKDQAKTVQGQDEEATASDEDLKKLGDDDLIPQSFATQNDPISRKLEGTETMKKLFDLKKGGKELTLNKVLKEFRTDERLWNAFDMPAPPQKKYLVYKWAKGIKEHPNYPKFKARILGSDTQALGSSYALSSSIPDNYGKLSMLSKLASKVGITEEDKEKFLKKLENFDFMTALVDQADPPKRLVSDFLQSIGIKDQALIDAIDVHGKWHQYYGKGMNTVEQSQVQFIEPIKDAMAKHGLENEVFGEYLLARAAPSRNLHLKEMYEAELKNLEKGSAEYKSIEKLLKERGDSLSGINTKDAIDRIKQMEAMDEIKNFIADETNPLQLFYDMNREALQLKSESGLIRSEGDIQEMKAMITAMSKYNINNISRARMRDNYNYAPMQGFEGETEKLFDNEMAYEAVGKSSTSSGRGWDNRSTLFLQKGAFGRTNTNVGPDPETVFAAAQEQYFDAAIRGHKNEVSNAFGRLFDLMRAIAYPDVDTVELPTELKNLSPEVKAKVKAEFDEVFQKEFKELDIKKDYEINEKQVQVNGEDVAGLKMVRREISTKFQNDPYVFVYRKNGAPHLIQFKKNDKGARMASSLKNLRYEALPRILQYVNRMTRFMARMFTSMNPAFIFPNFIRDYGTAAIHLSEDDKKNMVGKTLNGKRLAKFTKAIFKAEQALSKGEGLGFEGTLDIQSAQELLREGDHVKMYQFAKAAGAKIGMFRHKSIPELIDDLRKNKAKSKKGAMARLRSVGQTIESINTAIENSIRQSAFWSAIETGRSVSQAASISRNVTVDFNQKGNLTQAFGSLFVFFGASTNSAHRFARTLHKRGVVGSGALIGGIVAASFAVALFNRLIDDDEDEEMPDYDTITSFKRDTNLLLPLPGNIPGLEDKTGRDTGYFGIPLPLGYNVFWALGQTSADFFAKYVMGRGGSGAMDFMTRNLDATMNAFNPIGGATLATALMPTAGKPIVEMYANKNFMGSEIRKSDVPYETPKPAHMMDQKRTQEHWTDFSRFVNKVMGGDDQIKGTVGGLFGGNPLLSSEDSDYQFDLSGSEMEHLALGYLGGPGQIINMFFGDGLYPMFDNKEYNLEINKMPVVNRFIRTSTYGSATRRSYYQIREAAMVAKSSVDSARKVGQKHLVWLRKIISLYSISCRRSKIWTESAQN